MIKKTLLGIFFVLIFSGIVIAQFEEFPSTDPMRIEGDLLVNGSNAPAVNDLLQSVVSSGHIKDTDSDGSGVYAITVQGYDGDNVDLFVCGFLQASTTLDAESPPITKDIDIDAPLMPDGAYNCTCRDICAGGHCVNIGGPGVCSSDTFYCDGDGRCEPAYNETTANCNADCKRGGTTGGGGGSSSCEPEWNLTWSECIGGIQTVTLIVDLKSCDQPYPYDTNLSRLCAVDDVDSDGDGVMDREDGCFLDPEKIEPGECGCGAVEEDSDGDGCYDCIDDFPDDPTKCGDSDGDGIDNDEDEFPYDPTEWKDSDGDGVGDNADPAPNDPSITGLGLGLIGTEEEKNPMGPITGLAFLGLAAGQVNWLLFLIILAILILGGSLIYYIYKKK